MSHTEALVPQSRSTRHTVLGRALGAASVAAALALAGSATSDAKPSPRLTKADAAKAVAHAVSKADGESSKLSCVRAGRGRLTCRVTFRSASGKTCRDGHVTVLRRGRKVAVRGLKATCATDVPGVTVGELPTTIPGSVTPPGPPPGGIPGGGAAPTGQPSPGVPAGAPRNGSTDAPRARTAATFAGCTQWEQGAFLGYPHLWTYACFFDFGLYFEMDVYYWTGYDTALWFYDFIG